MSYKKILIAKFLDFRVIDKYFLPYVENIYAVY